MRLAHHVSQRWTLWLTLATVVAASAVFAVREFGDPGEASQSDPIVGERDGIPIGPPDEPVEDDAVDTAITALTQSELFDDIVGDTAYEIENIRYARQWLGGDASNPQPAEDELSGIMMHVFLEDPIDSSGPWRVLQCRGTRTAEGHWQWEGVSVIRAAVDSEGRLVEFAVIAGSSGARPSDSPPPELAENPPTMTDWLTGDVRPISRDEPLECPDGLSDD